MAELEYAITIERRTLNPKFRPDEHHYPQPQFLEQNVTTATLDPDQWRKVQAAIVEALR